MNILIPKTVAVTPTITAGIYSAADVVGGVLTFDVSSIGGGGKIETILIGDDDNEKAAAALYLFNGAPTDIADNAAFAPLIGDLNKLVYAQPILVSDYVTLNGNAYALYARLGIQYTASKLYGYLVCTGTPTYTAVTDLTITITVKAD